MVGVSVGGVGGVAFAKSRNYSIYNIINILSRERFANLSNTAQEKSAPQILHGVAPHEVVGGERRRGTAGFTQLTERLALLN